MCTNASVTQEDWFSKVVGKVSGFLKQDPNEKENYSAAKETAEQMQDVKNRRKELGVNCPLPTPSIPTSL